MPEGDEPIILLADDSEDDVLMFYLLSRTSAIKAPCNWSAMATKSLLTSTATANLPTARSIRSRLSCSSISKCLAKMDLRFSSEHSTASRLAFVRMLVIVLTDLRAARKDINRDS